VIHFAAVGVRSVSSFVRWALRLNDLLHNLLDWVYAVESRSKLKVRQADPSLLEPHAYTSSTIAHWDELVPLIVTPSPRTRQPTLHPRPSLFSYIPAHHHPLREHVKPISASIASIDTSKLAPYRSWTVIAAYHSIPHAILPIHKGQLRHSPPRSEALSSKLWSDKRSSRGG